MFHDVSPQMAGLVSCWCTTLLYGMTVVVYIVCIYVLIKRQGSRNPSATWILMGTSTIQFILATIHVAVALRLLIEGFIHTENVPNGAFLYWITPSTMPQIISKAIYVTNIIVADCVLIWRMYMVWGRNPYVCLPAIIMTCCSMVTGYIGITRLAQITGDLQATSMFEILNWMLSTWSLFIATQLLSTGLIAGKIWWHAKRNPMAKCRYILIIAVVVESGAILTLSTTFLLAFVDYKIQAGAILADIATQIATIIPTLIIIQVELIRNSDFTGIKQILVNQPTGCGCEHHREESSQAIQITVTTLSVTDHSDWEKELKPSV